MLVKIANAGFKMGQAGAGKERIRHMKVRKEKTLATKMAISLVAGLTAGLLFLFLREHLNSSGQEAVWTTINDLLFQDITAAGASSALGLFYLAGQMFIRSLQLVIVPMVFTSITLAIGQISDTSTLGRISFKCIKGFLICSFFALLLACVCGIVFYNMGVFHIAVDGLESVSGSTGSNPLLVVLNVIPSNIASTFSSNTAVLAVVFLAIALGLCMKTLGEEKASAYCGVGVPTLSDIVSDLMKPGRDPRDELPAPLLRTDILELKDLKPGMKLRGTVRNVVDFGAFVDIGVHQDGLVHISRLSDNFVRKASDVVRVGDVVDVAVIEVDAAKKRIALSMLAADVGRN